ncbi:MAG: RecQ family ATP-dependent DNA helicase [Acidimicrobiia bacterium]
MASLTINPVRPTADEVRDEVTRHVQALAGPDAQPRPEQLAAVHAMLVDGHRTLLVARTGFGKSAVYFSATRILRDRGWGPTVVVSPLLALMRDQVAAAEKLGLRAVSINSANNDAWREIEEQILADQVDLLLISPERLANRRFVAQVFQTIRQRPFALVCDEAHCISDWGHDFRPDYRRLRRLLDELSPDTPVLATTATANQRVTDDVAAQLGDDTTVLRTSLDRTSLYLSVVDLPDDAHRLAWLGQTITQLDGSGIVYCLTVAQAETTAEWLRRSGVSAHAYSGAVAPEDRLRLEDGLRTNDIKALVATSALGMGFDKADLAFSIHLGLPPSPVAYYQQIGRAGRAIDRAEVIAVPRPHEDEQVWKWFESVSMPSEQVCWTVLDQLNSVSPTSVAQLEVTANLGRSRLGTLLSILDVDGAVAREGSGWIRTQNPWVYNSEMVSSLRDLRREESSQMRHWATRQGCRLRYLREALDDLEADDCGRCDQCTDLRWHTQPDPTLVAHASELLRGGDIVIEPRKQWPAGLDRVKGRIKTQAEPGRALARLGDGGWNPIVQGLINEADAGRRPEIPPELVTACARVLKRWDWSGRPSWICAMPSRRRSELVVGLAEAIGSLGKLPVYYPLQSVEGSSVFQDEMSNSAHQVNNALDRLMIDMNGMPTPQLLERPVLLIDEECRSRWTFTAAASLLIDSGASAVLPFALRSF